jgi:hypothetical protein
VQFPGCDRLRGRRPPVIHWLNDGPTELREHDLAMPCASVRVTRQRRSGSPPTGEVRHPRGRERLRHQPPRRPTTRGRTAARPAARHPGSRRGSGRGPRSWRRPTSCGTA